jgi:ribosomal protein S27AE
MSDGSELVVAATYTQGLEAQLACSVLHAAGLEARVHDEYTVAAEWRYSNAIGGVKVVVRAEDLATARELLEQAAVVSDHDTPPPLDTEESSDDVCPRCGHHEWVRIALGKRIAILSLFIGLLLVPVRRRWKCGHCGYVPK